MNNSLIKKSSRKLLITAFVTLAFVNISNANAEMLTGPQKNAVRTATSYLNMSGFSRDGLIEQLSSPSGSGYDIADAIIAVDSLKVDWKE
jgi:hypothetical protein